MYYARRRKDYWPITLRAVLIAAIVAIVWAYFSGCQATASRKAFIGVTAATDIVQGVATAYDAKFLTKDQVMAIQPYADAVLAAQKKVLDAEANGDPKLSDYFQALTNAVVTLENAKAAAKRATTLPATNPS